MIDTILFDFVGVLLFQSENYKAGFLADEIDRQIGSVTNDALFRENITRTYHLSANELDKVLQAVVSKYEPYIPLWTLLPELRKSYKLGIINNGTYMTYPLFEAQYHISEQFDLFLSSAVEGKAKPDLAIYLRACEKLSTEPQNCLFMDDSKENILAAQTMGMQTIFWPDKESGFKEFKTFIHAHHGMKTG
jgi:HAD superfamily hydrolase (TIGR01509 family)